MKVIEQYILASKLICRPEGASIAELAERLNISERAVFSVLNNIDDVLHVDTKREDSNKRFVRYFATSDEVNLKLPKMDLSDMEKAYYQCIRDSEENEILGSNPAKVFTKLGILLAERGCYAGDGEIRTNPISKHRIPVEEVRKNISETIVPSIVSGIRGKKWMDISYSGEDGIKDRKTVFPVVIVLSSDGLSFLHGICLNNESFCIRISSIQSAKEKEYDAIPELPDIKDIVSDPFGPAVDSEPVLVELSLSGETALTEPNKTWPEQVSFTKEEDGTVTMRATTHSMKYCRRWVLERTPEAKVISPQSLKDEILEAHRLAIS